MVPVYPRNDQIGWRNRKSKGNDLTSWEDWFAEGRSVSGKRQCDHCSHMSEHDAKGVEEPFRSCEGLTGY